MARWNGDMLPRELILLCLSTMEPNDLCSLARTCKYFAQLVQDNVLWKTMYRKKWLIQTPVAFSYPGTNWMELYKERWCCRWKEALPYFDSHPTNAIEILMIEKKISRGDAADEIADFLHSKSVIESCWERGYSIANFILAPCMMNMGVHKAVMSKFDLRNIDPEDALRKLLQYTKVPDTASKVDILFAVFSERYFDCNPTSIFTSPDGVYAFFYACLMLNTDLHSAVLKKNKKISSDTFVRLTRGLNDGGDFPAKLLYQVYENIKAKPLTKPNQTVHHNSGLWFRLKSSILSLVHSF